MAKDTFARERVARRLEQQLSIAGVAGRWNVWPTSRGDGYVLRHMNQTVAEYATFSSAWRYVAVGGDRQIIADAKKWLQNNRWAQVMYKGGAR